MSVKVAKNTAYLVAAFVGQKILSLIYFTIIARAVGVEGSGRYFLALSLTTIFSVMVDLGLSNTLIRETAKRPEDAGKLLANVLGLKVGLALIAVAGVHATARMLGYSEETRTMISIASAVMVLDATHLVFYGVMRGFQNLRYEAIGVISGQAVTIMSGIFFVKSGFPLPYLVVALLIGSTWNTIWSGTMLVRKFGVRPEFKFDPAMARFFVKVTLPFALAGIFSRVYSYVDSIMLSKLVSEAEVGIYGVGYKIAFAFQFLPMAFAAAVYPAMSEYYVKDRTKLARIFGVSMSYLLLAAVPIVFGIAVLSEPIVAAVYGPAFAASAGPLRILMFSLIFAFLYWPCGSLLNACDRQAENTAVMGATMVGNVILNAFLVPKFASTGAAIAALVGNAMLFGGAYWRSRGLVQLDARPVLWNSLRIMVSGLGMAGALLLLMPYLHPIILIPFGALVYVGLIFATRAVTVAEVRLMANIAFRRGKTISDISSV